MVLPLNVSGFEDVNEVKNAKTISEKTLHSDDFFINAFCYLYLSLGAVLDND